MKNLAFSKYIKDFWKLKKIENKNKFWSLKIFYKIYVFKDQFFLIFQHFTKKARFLIGRKKDLIKVQKRYKRFLRTCHTLVSRNAVSPRAANMNAILWSEQLSLRALEWGRHCKNQKESPPFRDPFWGALGENRWISSSANLEPDRAVDLWWSEE